MKLSDPTFEAKFVKNVNGLSFKLSDSIDNAQGLWMYCPCNQGHHILIPFADKGLPVEFGPVARDDKTHPRWQVSGTSLDNLSLIPSVDVGTKSCWHGFITNGEVN